MKLGFIGLGHLGYAIAGRLIGCGHELVLYNRTQSKADGLNAPVASSACELASETEIIFVCLFDHNAVKDILTQKNGLLDGKLSGKIIIDLTTNHFDAVPEFYDLCSKAGGHYLESPVLGSVVPAMNGALTVLTSGDESAYERVKPILQDISAHLFFLKEPTLATKMKLVNNLALGSIMATLAEALAMAEVSGLKRPDVIDILQAGAGNSMVLNAKKGKLLSDDFEAHFSNALIYKDLHCLGDLAYTIKQPMPMASAAKDLYARTFIEGIEQEDFSAVIKLFSSRK